MLIDFYLLARLLLASVFGLAAVGKALNPGAGRLAISEFGVPASLAPALAWILPLTEIALAVLLLPARTARASALGALVLLTIFTVAILVSLLRGRRPHCACFGRRQTTPVGWSTIARNAALAACALIVLLAGPGDPASAVPIAGALVSALTSRTADVAVLLTLAGQAIVLWQLFKQQGRLLVRIDRLDARAGGPEPAADERPSDDVLPVGAPAPAFDATTPARDRTTLETLLRTGQTLVLIFSDPSCPICTTLLPSIASWQRAYGGRLRIALVSRATDQRVRLAWRRGQLTDVVLQHQHEVSEIYRVPATPAAIAIGADGTIRSTPRLGAEEIDALLREQSAGSLGYSIAQQVPA